MTDSIPLKVSYSGVRGIYGDALTEAVAYRFGAAFLQLLDEYGASGPILMGRDTRISGPSLAAAVRAALATRRSDIIDLGVVGTPTAQFAMRPWKAGAAVVITASHNPGAWNGFKFFLGPANTVLDGEQTRRLFALYQSLPEMPAPPPLAPGALPEVTPEGELAVTRHVHEVLGQVDVAAIRAARFRVALDTGGGAGERPMRRLLEQLGCSVEAVTTPRDSEPAPENLGALARATLERGCHLGMAQDLDGDRLALVSEKGFAIGEDYTLVLAVRHLLGARRASAPVVVKNASTTRIVDDLVAAAGGTLVETPVGEVNLSRALARMQAEGRVTFGGEGNGGVILPEILLGRDSVVGAALILDHMAQEAQTLSALVAALPSYHMIKIKVPLAAGVNLSPLLDRLAALWPEAEVSRLDGLRLSLPDRSWLAVRPSNTEPVLRVVAESPSANWSRDTVARVTQACRAAEGA